MPKYIVRFSALTDLFARVDVEAETPDQAIEIARQELDVGADFRLSDNGIDPIEGTVEPCSVDDADGSELRSIPGTSANDLVAAFKPETKLICLALIEGCKLALERLEVCSYGGDEEEHMEVIRGALRLAGEVS